MLRFENKILRYSHASKTNALTKIALIFKNYVNVNTKTALQKVNKLSSLKVFKASATQK